MAGYVRNAIAGLKDRESAVDEIMQEAESLLEQEKLTFHTATRLFGSLAITCDKTELLRTDEEGAPAYALDGRDRCYLCVPKGGLKLSRIVDGYLRPIPEVYMALPNQELTSGPHGNHVNKILDFFEHDSMHAGFAEGLARWWPWFEIISRYRGDLSPESQERKMVDVLLFYNFQENAPTYARDEGLFLQRTKKYSFTSFVEKNLVNERNKVNHGVVYSKAHVNVVRNDKQNLKVFLKDRGIILDTERLNNVILDTEENKLRFYHYNGGEKEHTLPCSIISLSDTPDKKIAARLGICGEIFECQQLEGILWVIDEEFADLLYLLKYAGVGTFSDGVDLPKQVTVDNAAMVVKEFNQLIDKAAEFIKANAVKYAQEKYDDEEKKEKEYSKEE